MNNIEIKSQKCTKRTHFNHPRSNLELVEQMARLCNHQYILYKERDLIMLLRLFIFLVDYMRKNKFIWGVGRGSAVSSFCLYLIGIHRVDPIKYNLDIKDFLK